MTNQAGWAVLLPLKPLVTAKSRLHLPSPVRHALVVAMALDVRDAVLACDEVRQIVVVTRDSRWRALLAGPGIGFAPDTPDDSLNAALRRAATACRDTRPHLAIAALPADLPALASIELSRALRAAAASATAFVPDARGDGTTLFAARSCSAFDPRYGMESRLRHRQAGAREIRLLPRAGIRQDVDTVQDLQTLQLTDIGRHTRAALRAAGDAVQLRELQPFTVPISTR